MESANKAAMPKRGIWLNAIIVGVASVLVHWVTNRFGLTAGWSYVWDLLLRGVLVVSLAVPVICLKDRIRR